MIAGHLYRNRSFTIRNDSSVSLDFSVSSVLKDCVWGGTGEPVGDAFRTSDSELSLSSSHFVLTMVRDPEP